MSYSIKDQIAVKINTFFNEMQSNIDNNDFLFNYHITIVNHSDYNVQLLSRKWYITDSNGETKVVVGDGVVGEQPILIPNQSYEYYSACMFKTGFGKMEGHYIFENLNTGKRFEVNIPSFNFVLPWILN